MFIRTAKTKSLVQKSTLNISKPYLQKVVEAISVPRHYIYEKKNNLKVRSWIKREFEDLGLYSVYQGNYDNVIATYDGVLMSECTVMIGGHYDSVPKSLGADDNASAIAGMLAVAKALKEIRPALAILFVAFNREEDGLIGSAEFVNMLPLTLKRQLKAVHILEMIGYCSHEANSQHIPEGLPVKVSNVGDFIAIISNKNSNHLIKNILKTAENTQDTLKVKALKVFFGFEKYFPHLSRSDHAPFWEENIPALMWTDTSEFRNPHYHKPSDTAETLDYDFMHSVVELLGEVVLEELNISLEDKS
jgi:Zn-dependent M28 family amino/carboxypeptidase